MKVVARPCPFCGSRKLDMCADNAFLKPHSYISCWTCDARGPLADSPERAADEWNGMSEEKVEIDCD